MGKSENKNRILEQYRFSNRSLPSDYADLTERNYNRKYGIYAPDTRNNISSLYQFIADVSGQERKTVVLALDAISYHYYMSVMRQYIPENISKHEKVLSSVFPSTTSSAWSSVITGEIPSVHGVYGTSYRINPGQSRIQPTQMYMSCDTGRKSGYLCAHLRFSFGKPFFQFRNIDIYIRKKEICQFFIVT